MYKISTPPLLHLARRNVIANSYAATPLLCKAESHQRVRSMPLAVNFRLRACLSWPGRCQLGGPSRRWGSGCKRHRLVCIDSGGGLLDRATNAFEVLVDRGPADLELPRDLRRPDALGSQAADFRDPSSGQRLAALVPARGLGPGDALDLPLAPEMVLELGEHAEHGVEHLPHRGGGIQVLLGDVEADVAPPQLLGDRDQVGERAPQAVDPRDGEHVALAQVIQAGGELGTVTPTTADLVGVALLCHIHGGC